MALFGLASGRGLNTSSPFQAAVMERKRPSGGTYSKLLGPGQLYSLVPDVSGE